MERLIRKQAMDQGVRDESRSKGCIKDKAKERWMLPAMGQRASDEEDKSK